MQCGLEQMNDCERSPNRTNLRVNFNEKGAEVKERREKFLTAKYGSHQMSLIRKRLAVEMWLYDELQKLFDPPVSKPKSTWYIIKFNWSEEISSGDYQIYTSVKNMWVLLWTMYIIET